MNSVPDPDISFITVNYNGLADTEELIRSLRGHVRSVSYEIIVVDNGSSAGEAAVLRERFPEVTVIRSGENMGFAGGNNLGIAAAKGRYLFFINNDTYIREDEFGRLMRRMEEHPEIGGISPKILFSDPGDTIQFAGYTPLTRITLRNALIGFGERDRGQYDKAGETPYLHGAAMMIRRGAAVRSGGMPECYFLYYEELDWSCRIREAGYTLWYDPACRVFHKESRSTGQMSPLRTFYLMRNRLLFARRNRKGIVRALSLGYLCMVAAPKDMLRFRLRKRPDLAEAVRKGISAYFRLK